MQPVTNSLRRRGPAGAGRTLLLGILRGAAEPMTAADLATRAGLHVNTTRQHLDRLVAEGRVTRRFAAPIGRGRPAIQYVADPDASAAEEDARPYAWLAATLAESVASLPEGASVAVAAGERWGREVAAGLPKTPDRASAVTRVVEILEAAGFAPEPTDDGDGGVIRLRRCPFGSLAIGRERAICGVHLGLMNGALDELGAPIEATRLDSFVSPDLCLAHLGSRADG